MFRNGARLCGVCGSAIQPIRRWDRLGNYVVGLPIGMIFLPAAAFMEFPLGLIPLVTWCTLAIVAWPYVTPFELVERNCDYRCCPQCGYDVRATPERCPECGRVLGNTGAAGQSVPGDED